MRLAAGLIAAAGLWSLPATTLAGPNPYLPPESSGNDCIPEQVRAGNPCPAGGATAPTFDVGPVNVPSLAVGASSNQNITIGSDAATVYMTAQSLNASAVSVSVSGSPCTVSGGTCVFNVQSTANLLPMTNPVTIAVYACETDPGGGSCAGSGAWAGETFQVTVVGGANPCTFTPTPGSNTVTGNATSDSFSLTVGGDGPCPWNASANQSWVTQVSPSSGSATGSSTINLTLEPNPTGQSRMATVTIDPQGTGLPNATYTVTQQGQPCTYSLLVNGAVPDMGNPVEFDQAGGAGTITVNTLTGCPWSEDRSPSWITLSPTSGTGSGSTTFTVAANMTGMPRSTTGDALEIEAQGVFVSQSAVTCSYSLSKATSSLAAGADSDTFNVTAGDPTCAWSVTDNQTWLTVSPSSGTGDSTGLTLSATANPSGLSRNATVSLRDASNQVVDTLVVTQDGLGCAYTLSPMAQSFPAAGGIGGFSFNLNQGCSWNASESVNWITFTSPSAGSSSGIGNTINVNYSVSVNGTVTPRNHNITVSAGGINNIHAVSQAGDCDISIDVSSFNFGFNGGMTTVNLTNPTMCDWTASDDRTWLSVSPTSGSANATLTITADINPAEAGRSGTVFIGDETVSITQDPQPDCNPSLSPTEVNVGHPGTSGMVTLTLETGCLWSAVSNDTWINMISPSNGDGGTTISYVVDANTGVSQRTGTVTIAEQTFTVVQSADVSVKINEVQQAPFDLFELVNIRGSTVNLGGLSFQFTGKFNSELDLAAVDLPSGGFITIPVNQEVWTPGSPGSLAIVDAEGVGIDFVRWAGATTPPPTGTTFSSGASPAPYTDSHAIGRDGMSTDTEAPADWCIQSPTPSSVNGACVDNTVLVNEVSTNFPNYIELFNFSTEPIDVAMWTLDATGLVTNVHTLQPAPLETTLVIEGGEYRRVEENNGVALYPGDCGFAGNPITNCGFESGSFSGWVVTDPFDTYDADPDNPNTVGGFPTVTDAGKVSTDFFGFFTSNPTEGSQAAVHGFDGTGDMGGPTRIEIAQDVSLDGNVRTLFFTYRAAWDLFTFCLDCTESRVFSVEIQPSGGGMPLDTIPFLFVDPGTQIFDTGNVLRALDVQAYAGQNVRIAFVWDIPEPYTGPAFFQLDNVSIVGIPPGTILTQNEFWWFNGFRGSVTLSDDGMSPLDFVRWGGSLVTPPPGTTWSGNAPVPVNSQFNTGRTVFSTDTDQDVDWCLLAPSSGAVNPLCDGEILLSDGFEEPPPP